MKRRLNKSFKAGVILSFDHVIEIIEKLIGHRSQHVALR